MPARSLPNRPNLTQLKNQASELRRAHRDGSPGASARVAAHHPRFRGLTAEGVLAHRLTVADAQLVVAREYGFSSWAALKHHVETARRLAKFEAHPQFEEAVSRIDAGDTEGLRTLLAEYPDLVRARTNLDPPYHYFTGATLLHHLAWNPSRDSTPKNVPDVCRVLLDAGADANGATFGPNSGTTMALVLSSKQASDADVSSALIDVLLEYGAELDPSRPDALHFSLSNHAPRAAEKLISLGATVDVCGAAALGRMDLVEGCFDAEGRLVTAVRRGGKALNDRDAIGLAMLFAYVNGKMDAVDYLMGKDGNWDMTGVNNGTALHRAAWNGEMDMVKRLVAQGADVNNRENPFTATPMSWAHHNGQVETADWIAANADVDLHDAASFGLVDVIEKRLAADPGSVDHTLSQWRIPMGTALHCAAAAKRRESAEALLNGGADPNVLAGNGLTALDVAVEAEAAETADLIRARGGRRVVEM